MSSPDEKQQKVDDRIEVFFKEDHVRFEAKDLYSMLYLRNSLKATPLFFEEPEGMVFKLRHNNETFIYIMSMLSVFAMSFLLGFGFGKL